VFAIDRRAAHAQVDYVEVLERHSFDPRVWGKLKQLIAERQIDVLHAHDYKTDVLAWLLSRATGARALATVHGWTGNSARERLCYYPIDKRVLARFPRLIAVSSEIARELVKHGAHPSRITTILNAIEPSLFRREAARVASARAALGLDPSDIVIGAVGRLERQKRFDLLIDAYAALYRDNPRLRLLIVGDGSLKGALVEQRDALGLAERVIFTGHVTDVIPAHHAMDLFVQSSDYEGTPNAVLEAMAMETPLVATEAGGTAELAQDGVHGRIIPIGKIGALISSITAALLAPDEMRRMADGARRRVENELSFESRCRRLETLYEEVVGHA
jgi:glycosyltransferase involved in cell wall biosynthesis